MKVYLSPSNQPRNMCALGHSEKVHCEELVQRMIPLLIQRGIEYKVKSPSASLSGAEAKAWGADLYLPLHTNAYNRSTRGSRFGYADGRTDSMKACQIFRDNFKRIYPFPDKVKTAVYNFAEARNPHCPSVYCETIFHDALADAQWFHDNMDRIALNFVESIVLVSQAQIPPKPTVPPKEEIIVDFTGHNAKIQTTYDAGLSLWNNTNRDKALIQVRKGEAVYVVKDHNPESGTGWATAEYKGVQGYVDKRYLVDLGAAVEPPVEPPVSDLVIFKRADWEKYLEAVEVLLSKVI